MTKLFTLLSLTLFSVLMSVNTSSSQAQTQTEVASPLEFRVGTVDVETGKRSFLSQTMSVEKLIMFNETNLGSLRGTDYIFIVEVDGEVWTLDQVMEAIYSLDKGEGNPELQE